LQDLRGLGLLIGVDGQGSLLPAGFRGALFSGVADAPLPASRWAGWSESRAGPRGVGDRMRWQSLLTTRRRCKAGFLRRKPRKNWDKTCHARRNFAPKGRNRPAQGNALGNGA